MATIIKLINNEPPGKRWRNNLDAAVEAAKRFEIEIVSVPKSKAGVNAKAPAVYLNDKLIAEIGSLREGAISLEELINELRTAGVPERPGKGGWHWMPDWRGRNWGPAALLRHI